MSKLTRDAVNAFNGAFNYQHQNTRVVATKKSVTMLVYERVIAERKNGTLWVQMGGSFHDTSVERLNGLLADHGYRIENKDGWRIGDMEWDGKPVSLDEINLFDPRAMIEGVINNQIVELPFGVSEEHAIAAARKHNIHIMIVQHKGIPCAGLPASFELSLFLNPELFADYVFMVLVNGLVSRLKSMYVINHLDLTDSIDRVQINHAGELIIHFKRKSNVLLKLKPELDFPEVIGAVMASRDIE